MCVHIPIFHHDRQRGKEANNSPITKLTGATSATAGASSAGFSSPLEPRGRIVGIPRLSNVEPAAIICLFS